jgi:hypothetical protein
MIETPFTTTTSYADNRTDPSFWSRADIARVRADFADPQQRPVSQRVYSFEHGIPRSTLGDWLRDPGPTDLPAELVAFMRSPIGEIFLRRLVIAALICFRHEGPCGIRPVSHFLELSWLDHFVGSSYGALYSLDDALQSLFISYDDEVRPVLAAHMAKHASNKMISLVPDENYHGDYICLVGIEPVSNFIVVEQYTTSCTADIWNQAIKDKTKDWSVVIVQMTSDQSSVLICCAEEKQHAHYSPDLLHLQRDLFKPLLLPLMRPINKGQKELEKVQERLAELDEMHRADRAGDTKAAKKDYFDQMIEEIRKEILIKEDIKEGQGMVDRLVEEVRGIGDDYRPFDYQTGEPVTAQQVGERLQERLDNIEKVVQEAELGEKAKQGVAKGRQWTVLLVGCVAWFWTLVSKCVEELELSEEAERQLKEQLIAGYYWEAQARKGRDAEDRQRMKELAERLIKEAWAEGGALANLTEDQKQQVEQVARQCALLFQRSSSCVEGRNGRLSLFHHAQGKLSSKRLTSLTVVHNYLVERPDGTTAAERLFGTKPPDLFDWLLQRIPDLPRPAAKRTKRPASTVPEAA